MNITVMITTKNRAVDLEKTLGVLKGVDPQPLEVLITADGCSDDTVHMLESEKLKTELKNLSKKKLFD